MAAKKTGKTKSRGRKIGPRMADGRFTAKRKTRAKKSVSSKKRAARKGPGKHLPNTSYTSIAKSGHAYEITRTYVGTKPQHASKKRRRS